MDLRDKTALVIDDDEYHVMILQRVLEYVVGCNAITASNGQEAQRLLEAGNIDIILCDLIMPHGDGLELIQFIRSDPRLADTVVIAMTASVAKEDEGKVLMAGYDGFLQKPFHPTLLKEKLETIFLDIQQRRAADRLNAE